MKHFLATAGLVLLSSVSSFAAVIPTFTGAPVGNTWNYIANLAADDKLDPTQVEKTTGVTIFQGVIIYDFAGYVPGSAGSLSGNWVATVQATGPVIAPTLEAQPGDNPGLVNLVFQYVGPAVTTPGPFDVLFADSIYTNQQLDDYQGQGLKNTPLVPNENNTAAETGGFVTVPASNVPEPGSLGLMGAGVVALACALRRRS